MQPSVRLTDVSAMKRNLAVQVAILIVAASVVAVVANGFASRTRRLVLPGYYPLALRVPPREPERVPPPPRTETAPLVETTTTIAPALPAPTTTTDVGRASARPPEATTTIAAPTPTTTTPTPAPPERRAEARPTVGLAKFQPHPN